MNPCRQRQPLSPQRGFSLLELLVAIGMFSTFLLLSLDSFWKASDAVKSQQQVMTRLRTIHSLIDIMGMPSTLRVAAEKAGHGSPLRKCLYGGGCEVDKIQALTLYLPIVIPEDDTIKTSGAITGPPDSPILYNFDGEACEPGESKCLPSDYPISVSTQFQGVCPPAYDLSSWPQWNYLNPVFPDGLKIDPKNCWQAQYIRVFFKITATPGTLPFFFFNPVSGSLMINGAPASHAY